MKIAPSAWLLCLLVSNSLLRDESSFFAVGHDDSENDVDSDEEKELNKDDDDDESKDKEEGPKSVYDPENEDPLDVCRRNPTWKGNGVSYETCQKLTGWYPRDELNRNSDHLSDEKRTIGRCVDDKFRAVKNNSQSQQETHPWAQCNELDRNEHCFVEATSLNGVYYHKNDGNVVTMSDALTEQEAFGIQALVDCMHEILPQELPFYEERTFGIDKDKDGNDLHEDVKSGNAVTYTHALLQMHLPGVASTIYRLVTKSYQLANWENTFGLPEPSTLGLRTAEYIHYENTAYLGHHQDNNSIFSISIALSHPNEYQGGAFHLWSGEAMFKVPRLSAIAFLSEKHHAISQVTGGERNAFVVELWEQFDTPLGMPRPVLANFEQYLKQQGLAMEME